MKQYIALLFSMFITISGSQLNGTERQKKWPILSPLIIDAGLEKPYEQLFKDLEDHDASILALQALNSAINIKNEREPWEHDAIMQQIRNAQSGNKDDVLQLIRFLAHYLGQDITRDLENAAEKL